MSDSLLRNDFKLSFELESPFLTQGVTRAAFGYDASQAVNAAGHAILPQDLIKGNLLQAMRDLAVHARKSGVDQAMIAALFGEASEAEAEVGSTNDPRRGCLAFEDLVGPRIRSDEGVPLRPGVTIRIKIDEETGSVQAGALQVIELPFATGAKVLFSGRLSLTCATGDQARIVRGLERAIALIPALGAFKTVGFGRVVKASLAPVVAVAPGPAAGIDSRKGRRLAVELRLDRPLSIDTERVGDNVFRSRPIIPGTAIKGALAEGLRRQGGAPEKDDALSRLVIGHAFPCPDEAERSPMEPLPLSLAVFETPSSHHSVIDWLWREGPPLLEGVVGAFEPRWKDKTRALVRKACGWPDALEIPHDIRVHTAVNPETGSAAEGELYSMASLRPEGLVWRGSIDGGEVSEDEFSRLAQALAGGLEGLGKTGARAMVTLLPLNPPILSPRPGAQSLWAVTLRTAALMNDQQGLAEGVDVATDYARYWTEASKGCLRLIRHFAIQDLAGGYIAVRRRLEAGRYRPFLLSRPGSVFLLEGMGDVLEGWLRTGLPPRGGLGHDDWRRCPYLPQNGYGAIDVNHCPLGAEVVHV